MVQDRALAISWPVFLAGSGFFLIVTFTLLEPDISDPLRGAALLMFWTLHVVVALVLLQSVQILLSQTPFMMKFLEWVQITLSGLIGALLFSPIAAGLDWVFGIEGQADDPSEPLIEALGGEFTGSVGLVMVVWIALNVTRLLHIRKSGPVQTQADESAPAFWDKVPKALGRDLVALSAELHYMRVHTAEGDALILYPFGQAIAELEDQGGGIQIHRSHWVSLSQVARVTRRGQGGLCLTTTDIELPVSRSRRKALETALPSMLETETSIA